MFYLGVGSLILATGLCVLMFCSVPAVARWFAAAGSLIFFGFGAYITTAGAYALAAGFLIIGTACIVWMLSRRNVLFWLWLGFAVSSATAVVLVSDLFQNPISGPIGKEDRGGFTPLPVLERTAQDMLALPWSTRDAVCDWPVATIMCKLCKIAYESPTDAEDRIKEEFGWDSQTITGGSMQGYVIDAGDDAILLLRGTENQIYDIAQDLRFLKSKTGNGSIHGGFADGYDSMHEQVKTQLEKYKTKRVWITGHSLGGGMSIVSAYRILNDDKYEIAGVMTFGQPKAVLQDMANYLHPKLDGRYVFFVNDMDPVTRLMSPYKHFGHMVRWDDNDIIRSTPIKLAFALGPEPETTEGPMQEAGYIDDLSDEQLDRLIEDPYASLDTDEDPVNDPDGHPTYKGSVPDSNDHNLDGYLSMLEKLHTHSTKKLPE